MTSAFFLGLILFPWQTFGAKEAKTPFNLCHEEGEAIEKSLWYYKLGEKVAYGDHRGLKVLEGANATTFCALRPSQAPFLEYGRDTQHIYYEDLILPGVQPADFTLLWGGIGRGANQIFVLGKVIDVEHPESFAIVGTLAGGSDRVATKDQKAVYSVVMQPFALEGHRVIVHPVEGANPSTFTLIDFDERPSCYAKDAAKVFRFDLHQEQRFTVLQGANPSSFEVLGETWSKDATKVFWYHDEVRGAHAPTFSALYLLYAKDEHQVYYGDQLIDGADAQSFKCVKGHGVDATDDKREYSRGIAH
ncbi:MAG: DKNYY domain-containing protein [Proteobacteria bacterium]|nr:DKNYY domain-containing protein [Pseudomonadota bacterium]